ncbi:hypothetical protein AB0N56_36505 [Streptomyces microflavus]|uniref:hypothetical protein n=1 Tax=Streptomyces microflavus TaxID=1919 RepID=UPI00224DF4F8|nr:hypothetical protein [Streptomyces microflavus]MCX4657567.1 hypothetical protein [Streptomyces microflavus]
MLALTCLALVVLAVLLWRAMDKIKEEDRAPIVRFALAAVVILVLAFVAMRIAPPEEAGAILHQAVQLLMKS